MSKSVRIAILSSPASRSSLIPPAASSPSQRNTPTPPPKWKPQKQTPPRSRPSCGTVIPNCPSFFSQILPRSLQQLILLLLCASLCCLLFFQLSPFDFQLPSASRPCTMNFHRG